MSDTSLVRVRRRIGVVPTGMALALAILRQGRVMLDAPDRTAYLQERALFFDLLVIADNDQIAAPFLAQHVQAILDEESHQFRARRDKP